MYIETLYHIRKEVLNMSLNIGSSYQSGLYNNIEILRPGQIKTASGDIIAEDSAKAKQLKRIGQLKCTTCAERKYKDGSDEGNVSFKSAAHISPQRSASAVMSHEMEHVANAYKDAAKNDGHVVAANVKIKTAICPECGRSYVAGGLTTTQIKYDKSDEYSKSNKELIDDAAKGNNLDYSV
jgi:hypothetical protein